MKIEVLIQGEPDIKPLTKIFSYEKSDEQIFYESTQVVKKRLQNNLRLNVNETIWLFVSYIVTSINEGKPVNTIQKNISKLLSSNQVMIGVPESLRLLTFKIFTKMRGNEVISVKTPIEIKQYFFYEGKQSA